jgi:hypothetical protein
MTNNKILAVINSPAFLWLVTAIFITVAGAFYTAQQQCTRDANQLIDQYYKLSDEIWDRQIYVLAVVNEGKTLGDVKAGLKQIPYTYLELKDRQLGDLVRAFHRVAQRIDGYGHRALVVGTLPDQVFSPDDFMKFQDITVGRIGPSWKDEDMPPLKLFATRFFALANHALQTDSRRIVASNCSIRNIVKLMLDPNTPILSSPDINPRLDG